MDEDLYDEFGTYIGPEIEDDFESASSEEDWRGREEHVVEPETHMAVETPGMCRRLLVPHRCRAFLCDCVARRQEVLPRRGRGLSRR